MYSFFWDEDPSRCLQGDFGGFQDVYRLMYSTVAGSSQFLVLGLLNDQKGGWQVTSNQWFWPFLKVHVDFLLSDIDAVLPPRFQGNLHQPERGDAVALDPDWMGSKGKTEDYGPQDDFDLEFGQNRTGYRVIWSFTEGRFSSLTAACQMPEFCKGIHQHSPVFLSAGPGWVIYYRNRGQ